jgi:isoleucyl-tRNA synthetase
VFESLPQYPDHPALEKEILDWWDDRRVFDRLRERNRDGPKWSFIDGPITANNPMGIHHAWGRCLKDVFQRYKALRGHELRYQNGFDSQGLWVEVEVEKSLGLRSKRETEEYGLA